MDLRLTSAILVGKIISKLNKLKGTGGTAAPGLYALKIDSNLVKKLHNRNNLNSVVVSGTNGKTTTARLISSIVGEELIHNRQGSNLLRGVASTLISQASFTGKLNSNFCLWEADEAALVDIAEQVNPKVLVLLNLFRDQLDRYGEIDTTRNKWQQVVKNLPKTSTLILSADDPSTNYLNDFAKCKVVLFGVETKRLDLPTIENVADIKYCIKCSSKLTYSKLYSAHLGIYKCSNCDFKRQEPQIKATKLDLKTDFSSKIKIASNQSVLTFNYPLPGLYNAYNVLAAYSVAAEINISKSQIRNSINKFKAAFGRFQSVTVREKSAVIFLIKNPAGANEVIRTIAAKDNLNLLVLLNDNIADGRDVSWIWDTNWEALASKVGKITISGSRAFDLANRLKYAGFRLNKSQIKATVKEALVESFEGIEAKDQLLILPTYTALLEVENVIKALGGSKWHEN